MTTLVHRLAALLMLLAAAGAAAGPCDAPIALQVLGSGGPEAQQGRASAGYLVWLDGKARVLVDLGGGSFARFGASGARFADLDLIALTHLHADHATDLPALAYRVDIGEQRIVFSGDMNGDDPWFVDFARGADLLIMDHAVPEDAGPVAARLHALPSEIAAIAKEAEIGHLVLSHLMRRSERALDGSLAQIRRVFSGPVSVAEDLACFTP